MSSKMRIEERRWLCRGGQGDGEDNNDKNDTEDMKDTGHLLSLSSLWLTGERGKVAGR